jgi:hypothetical protein
MQERQIPLCVLMSGTVGCGELSKILSEVAKETGIKWFHSLTCITGRITHHFEYILLREIPY